MATYPVKMLKDVDGTLFIPLTSSDSVQTSTGDTLENLISAKVDKETGKGLSTNDYTTTEKNKLAGIAANAEVNQNAFSNVKVGSTTIAADGKTDTLELAAGSNITLTPDATNDKVTIAATQPTVNNGTLTIQKNGTNVQTFTANQSSNVTANITVPTKTSELTNDSNFITNTGSTSGNAGTATTLQTFTYNRNNNTNTWFKVATTTITKQASQWPEKHAFLFIKGGHNSNYNQNGIIAIDAIGNGQSGKIGSYNAQFMSATTDLNLENFYIEYLNGDADNDGIVNFWIRANTNGYASWQIKILQNSGWTIASSSPTMTEVPTSGYTGKNAIRSGYVARSIGDKNGDDITTTYYKASNPNGYTSNTGTVTSVTLKATSPISIDSSSAITTSGTRTLSHANSGVTAGTYKSVTVNATGHVTAGTNPTTLSGYGITDAKIASGVITLGSNTITPLTAASTLDATKLSGTIPSGCYTDTKNTAGSTDTSSKIFLIGATSQAANPQTYSDNEVYATSGVLTTKSVQVGGTAATMQYNSTDKCIEFVFA